MKGFFPGWQDRIAAVDAAVVRDAQKHRYYASGRQLKGVTSLLSAVQIIDLEYVRRNKPELLQDRSELGTVVHDATLFYDEADLDESCLSDVVAAYLGQWKRFREETGFVPILREQRVYSPSMGYAGTLDRCGLVRRPHEAAILLDVKTGSSVPRGVGPQTAAYARALRELEIVDVSERWCVKLSPKTYRVQPLKKPTDWRAFEAALWLDNWKEKA